MFDLFLTPKEVSDLLGITVQGVHKTCKELNLDTKHGSRRKIYPDQFRKILESRGGVYPKRRKIAVHNLKGGVGKTTLVHAIGTRCSTLGFRTLLIDADKQANLTSTFGIDPEKLSAKTIKDLFEDVYQRDIPPNYDSSLIKVTDYLDLIPATLELANLDLSIQHHSPSIEKVFSKVFAPIEDDYDLILFDLAPDFNRTTLAIHAYCNQALIPVVLGKFALSGVHLTYKHINFVASEYSLNIDRKIIINRFDARHSLTLARHLSTEYAADLLPTVIPVANSIENTFAEEENIWSLNKSKCAALEGFDSLIANLFSTDRWKTGNLSPTKKREAEQNV